MGACCLMPLSEPGFSAATFDGPLVVTPAPTDRFVVRQADGVVRVETRAQIHTLEVGEELLTPNFSITTAFMGAANAGRSRFLPESPSATNPNIIPVGTDIDTGIGRTGADQLSLVAGAVQVANCVEAAGLVQFILPLQNAIATPSLVVDGGSSGLFASATDIVVMASNSQNCMEYSGVGAVPLLGFYGTAAIAKQLGVAVTAAGIHAALVALGFIT